MTLTIKELQAQISALKPTGYTQRHYSSNNSLEDIEEALVVVNSLFSYLLKNNISLEGKAMLEPSKIREVINSFAIKMKIELTTIQKDFTERFFYHSININNND